MPDAALDPLLEIVIVVSNGDRENIRGCLESLRRNPLQSGPTRVTVVDNASTDGTREVMAEFPEAVYERLDWNAGFAYGNNHALRSVSAPFVLVLNPDTEISEDVLDQLFKLLQSQPEIGMVGCRLELRDGSFDHAAKRSFPTPLGALAHFTGFGRRAGAGTRLAQYRAPDVDESGSGEVDAINGAFMFTRRAAMEEVGLFDEVYWTYMEDLDWCYRFKQHGWKVWYDGTVTVLHIKGGTTKKRGHRALRTNYFFHRGMARFYRKFYAQNRPFEAPFVFVAILAKFVLSATRSAVARRGLT